MFDCFIYCLYRFGMFDCQDLACLIASSTFSICKIVCLDRLGMFDCQDLACLIASSTFSIFKIVCLDRLGMFDCQNLACLIALFICFGKPLGLAACLRSVVTLRVTLGAVKAFGVAGGSRRGYGSACLIARI